ncbi:SDR family oxidoreductase [Methanimicrococcus sp. OttesenSCG-928-J09]|nr:SDR family oxidoreductase [Methanimicrococcus sp. OttesenSCG-928-J09]
MNRLEKKVSIIVGATSGIGREMAKLFAEEGSKVVFTGRRKEQGEQIEAEIRNAGYEASFFQADSTNEEDLKKLVAFTLDKYGSIDVLCNNAGILMASELTDIDLVNEFDKMMDVNVKSYIRAMQLVIPIMQKQGGGSIVNTASIGALQALPATVTYSITKAAVKHMTESAAAQYIKDGIRINAILPGLTLSDMIIEGEDFEKHMSPLIPIGRTAKPREIAHGALYLASDDASYCVGASLIMDGGLLLE